MNDEMIIRALNPEGDEEYWNEALFLLYEVGKTSLSLASLQAVASYGAVFVGLLDKRIRGVVVAEVLGSLEVEVWNKILPENLRVSMDAGPAVLLAEMAVERAYRRRGIGGVLTDVVRDEMMYGDNRKTFGRIYATSRRPQNGDSRIGTSLGLLKDRGFKPVWTFPLWYEDMGNDYRCEMCHMQLGLPRCQCDAILLEWTRPEAKEG